MGATVTTDRKNVVGDVQAHMEAVRTALIKALSDIGEKCVSDARLNGSYTDRTGNLRGSVGYVVADGGSVVASSTFASVLGATEGPQTGYALAESVAKQHVEGLVLVLVAGMAYAEYVADKGFNVLDSAEILAEKLVGQLTVEASW